MFRIKTALLVLPALIGLVSNNATFAQSQNQQPQSQTSPRMEVVALSFPGGTVQEYTEALRKVAPGCNVLIAAPEVGVLPVPRVHLTDVTVRSAVELLSGDVWLDDGTACFVGVGEIQPKLAGARSVFRISLQCERRASRRPEVHVWSVSDLISNEMTEESILTAIETSVEILGGERPRAQIRFHGETGLILASGDDDQLTAIDRVVDGLHDTSREQQLARERQVKGDAGGASDDALRKVTEEIAQLRQQLAKQSRTIEQLQAHVGK